MPHRNYSGSGRGCGRGWSGKKSKGRGMGQGASDGRRMGLLDIETSCRQTHPVAVPLPPSGVDVSGISVAEEPHHILLSDSSAIRCRLPGRRTVVIVVEEECIGCGVCAEVCPVDAITMTDIAVIDSQKCAACGLCVAECPNEALALTEQKPVESQ